MSCPFAYGNTKMVERAGDTSTHLPLDASYRSGQILKVSPFLTFCSGVRQFSQTLEGNDCYIYTTREKPPFENVLGN